jgi:hypothetical protein
MARVVMETLKKNKHVLRHEAFIFFIPTSVIDGRVRASLSHS